MSAFRRHRGIWFGGGVIAVLALAIVVGEISGWSFLRHPLQSAATSAAKVPVTLDGDFHARFLWRPTLRVGHLTVGAASGVQGADALHVLDATAVDLRWSWLDIWRWRGGAPLRLQRLHAGTLDGRLIRDAAGHATWQIGAKPDPAVKVDNASDSGLDALPRIGSLQIGQGLVVLSDQVTDTDLKIEIDGGEALGGAASGYRAQVQGRWHQLPLALKLSSGAVLPLLVAADGASADAAEPGVDFRLKGTAGAASIDFEGRAAAVLGARQLSGSLQFSGPSLADVGQPLGVTLPRSPPFALKGQLAHDDGVWRLQAERAAIGSSQLDADFSYDTRATPPRLTGRLGGKRLALADLGPAVGTPRSDAEARVTAAPDRVLPDRRFDLPSLRVMDADVQVAIGELDLGSDLIEPLQQLRTHLTLEQGVLRLQDLSASAGGGNFAGSSSLDGQDAGKAKWALDLRFGAVDIARWMQGLQKGEPAAKSASVPEAKAYLTGKLSGRLDVKGAGNSTAAIIGNLNGSSDLRLDNGTISQLVTEAAGLDIAQALGLLIKGDVALPMRCARAAMAINDGIVKIQRLVVDNADSTIRAAGRINLQEESLMLMAASRPKDFSPLSLNSTVTITGMLKSPTIGIDGGRLAAKAAGAAVLGAVVAPVAALLAFVEFGDNEPKSDACAVAAAGAAASGVAATARGASATENGRR